VVNPHRAARALKHDDGASGRLRHACRIRRSTDAASRRGADTDHMIDRSLLSKPQARFAAAKQSSYNEFASSGDSVFMYREGQWFTDRWLVARDGKQLEWERLSYRKEAA
jgi:hypothetical protein